MLWIESKKQCWCRAKRLNGGSDQGGISAQGIELPRQHGTTGSFTQWAVGHCHCDSHNVCSPRNTEDDVTQPWDIDGLASKLPEHYASDIGALCAKIKAKWGELNVP